MINDYRLMSILEGVHGMAYDCPLGFRSVAVGFNMDDLGARKVWEKMGIHEDFDEVYNRKRQLSHQSGLLLFRKTWKWCEKKAKQRCVQLDVDYETLPDWHKYVLKDIVYNTGSVSNWSKVFKNTESKDVLYEARRRPKEMMDSRVAKIGKYFGLIDTLEDAKAIGLVHAKYLR